MIGYEEHTDDGWVELTLDGKVTREGLDEVVGKLGALMDARGEVGLLKHIVSFEGIEPAALWDDLKFAFRHLRHVGPVAVVSDKRWIEVWTKLSAPLWGPGSRFFEEDDLDEARAWLAERTAARAREAAGS